MEFLNGPRAQPLKLLLRTSASKQEGCSLYNLLLQYVFFSPSLLAESKLLRQKSPRHWPVAVCLTFFGVCRFVVVVGGSFQKGFVRK